MPKALLIRLRPLTEKSHATEEEFEEALHPILKPEELARHKEC